MASLTQSLKVNLSTKLFDWHEPTPSFEVSGFLLFSYIAQFLLLILIYQCSMEGVDSWRDEEEFGFMVVLILSALASFYLSLGQMSATARRLRYGDFDGFWLWLGLVFVLVAPLNLSVGEMITYEDGKEWRHLISPIFFFLLLADLFFFFHLVQAVVAYASGGYRYTPIAIARNAKQEAQAQK